MLLAMLVPLLPTWLAFFAMSVPAVVNAGVWLLLAVDYSADLQLLGLRDKR